MTPIDSCGRLVTLVASRRKIATATAVVTREGHYCILQLCLAKFPYSLGCWNRQEIFKFFTA